MRYCIGNYEVSLETNELLRDGIALKIQPLSFRLLVFMLENPYRLIPYGELIEEVWKSRYISNSTLNAAISVLRHTLDDSGRIQQLIKTVPGCGYRFIAPVDRINNGSGIYPAKTGFDGHDGKMEVYSSHCTIKSSLSPIPSNVKLEEPCCLSLKILDQPSIAVTDFAYDGADEGGNKLAHGLSIDINCSLVALPNLLVIARPSVLALAASNLTPLEISQQLGVRYLLCGHVRRCYRRIRATMTVIDATRNIEIWSEHYDWKLDDVFQIQDELVHLVVMTIENVIAQAEIDRAHLAAAQSLNALELNHKGLV